MRVTVHPHSRLKGPLMHPDFEVIASTPDCRNGSCPTVWRNPSTGVVRLRGWNPDAHRQPGDPVEFDLEWSAAEFAQIQAQMAQDFEVIAATTEGRSGSCPMVQRDRPRGAVRLYGWSPELDRRAGGVLVVEWSATEFAQLQAQLVASAPQ